MMKFEVDRVNNGFVVEFHIAFDDVKFVYLDEEEDKMLGDVTRFVKKSLLPNEDDEE